MQKRGQVAIFFIIGIVIIILIALIFVGRKEYGIGVPKMQFLNSKLDNVKKDLTNCIDKTVLPIIKKFADQGGDLNPTRSVLYLNRRVKYLCYNIENDNKCINIMPPLNSMINDLDQQINEDVKQCLNKDLVKNGLGYDVVVNGEPKTNIEIIGENLVVNVNYDVTFVKNEFTNKLNEVSKEVNVPIVELYNVAHDVVNSHAEDGFFEQLFYMLNKKGAYIVNVDKSPSAGNVGDIIYRINEKDSDFQFWFAIEGDK